MACPPSYMLRQLQTALVLTLLASCCSESHGTFILPERAVWSRASSAFGGAVLQETSEGAVRLASFAKLVKNVLIYPLQELGMARASSEPHPAVDEPVQAQSSAMSVVEAVITGLHTPDGCQKPPSWPMVGLNQTSVYTRPCRVACKTMPESCGIILTAIPIQDEMVLTFKDLNQHPIGQHVTLNTWSISVPGSCREANEILNMDRIVDICQGIARCATHPWNEGVYDVVAAHKSHVPQSPESGSEHIRIACEVTVTHFVVPEFGNMVPLHFDNMHDSACSPGPFWVRGGGDAEYLFGGPYETRAFGDCTSCDDVLGVTKVSATFPPLKPHPYVSAL